MYHLFYKKSFVFSLILAICFILFGTYYLFIYSVSPIRNIEYSFSGNIMNIDVDSIRGKSKYDFLQVYVYPDELDFTCESSNDRELCEKLIENKDYIYTTAIGSQSFKFDENKDYLTVENTFGTKELNINLFKNIFYNLYSASEYNNVTQTGYEKYFEFKRENLDDEITLNNSEILCAEQIVSSVLPGSLDSEQIIAERIQNECSVYSSSSPEINALGDITELEFNLNIHNYNVKFEFYKKDGNNFQKVFEGNKIIQTEEKINLVTTLGELLE